LIETLISVCLCTYKRSTLQRTLASLVSQKLPPDTSLEVVIVDNDSKGSAWPIVEKYTTKLNINYSINSERNLSAIRNATIRQAKGDYLAFIDDDEWADSAWISVLLLSIVDFDADAVLGKVITEYPDHAPDWIVKGNYFGKSDFKSNCSLSRGHTCNALLNSKWINQHHFEFDLEFGKTGGEDTDLFHRIYLSGGKIIFNKSAVVFEIVEDSRLNFSYLKDTNISIGQIHWKYLWSRQSGIKFWTTGFEVFLKIVFSALLFCLSLPFGKTYYMKWYLLYLRNLEKIQVAIAGCVNDDKKVERYGCK